jgi:hypothetical protein
MAERRPPRSSLRKQPAKDRRAGPGSPAIVRSMRQLKGLLSRPLGVARRNGGWRVVFVERRKGLPADLPTVAAPPPARAVKVDEHERLCSELRGLLRHHAGPADTTGLHHLTMVYEALLRKGWAGVEALPAPVLGQALNQAQRLARRQPAAALDQVVDRLRQLLLAADRKAGRDLPRSAAGAGELLVSEASAEEFDETHRSWFGTLPPADDEHADRNK